jgi:hypothetical protein
VNNLRNQAQDTDTPALRYTCLAKARDLAIQVPDFDLALRCTEQLGQEFAVNAVQEMLTVLDPALRSPNRNSNDRQIFLGILKVIEEIKKADAFAATPKIVLAEGLLVQRNPKERGYIRTLDDRVLLLKKIEKEYKKVKTLYPLAESDPPDPKACKAVGRYCAFVKGDWARGLPLLAACADEALVTVAKQDLASPKEPQAQIALGDSWHLVADSENEPAKSQIQKRARYWFTKAFLNTPDNAKEPLAERLQVPWLGGSVLRPGMRGDFLKDGRLLKQRVDFQLKFPTRFSTVDADLPDEGFSVAWQGFLWVTEPVEVIFGVKCNGTFDLRVDGKAVLSGNEVKNDISTARFLFDGPRSLDIIYRNLGGDASFELTCRPIRFGNWPSADEDRLMFYHVGKKKGR